MRSKVPVHTKALQSIDDSIVLRALVLLQNSTLVIIGDVILVRWLGSGESSVVPNTL